MIATKRLRASAVCHAEGHLLIVRLRDPVTGVVAPFPPGGGVEPGELSVETARRETLEETGLRANIDAARNVIDTYPFCWAGMDYEVTTHYFAACLEDAFSWHVPAVKDADYNLGAAWLPVDEALDAMSVHPRIKNACARVLRLASSIR